ncbi:MAG: alpha/beta hydrolase [Reichenbachiella sp.]
MRHADCKAQVISLWGNTIPNSIPSSEKEQQPERDIIWYTHVQIPTLEIFLPTEQYATGQAVLICPGGGYTGLAYDWEGTDIAKWLNGYGIAAFVLKYRTPYSESVDVDHLAPLQDAQRGIRVIRSNAKKWNIDSGNIGVMGFSAGGHLASTLGTQWENLNEFDEDEIDKLSAKPNFMVLIYPVISMKEGVTHNGSRNNLLGKKPKKELVNQFSNELQVSENTPVTFLLHSQDDKAVPVKNSLLFFEALNANNIKTELHILPKGGHGYSLGRHAYPTNSWPPLLIDWLQNR